MESGTEYDPELRVIVRGRFLLESNESAKCDAYVSVFSFRYFSSQ